MTALGLMSGTSLDGVDIALVETDGETVRSTGPAMTVAYDSAMRDRLRSILGGGGPVAEVELDVTRFHALVIEDFRAQYPEDTRAVAVIGFHGHTILHRPHERRTWQIGDGALLSTLVGLPVVNDFRSADVQAGGQGAPLVPVYHRALAHGLEGPLAVLNIGGVANVTWIGGDGSMLAFDTGPGGALLDDWVVRHTGEPMDRDGVLSRAGTVLDGAVSAFAAHPYFSRLPPKSLDRDEFGGLAQSLVHGAAAADGAATLAAITVQCVAMAARHFPQPVRRWLVCGGGRHNPVIMERLAQVLGQSVEAVEVVGWDGDALEAQAFGFLAVRSLRGLPLTYPGTTGGPAPSTGGRSHGWRAI